mmetsp:Transcript_9469/g.38900  ORF Transcript_9469/g.38900 Transcript_9469/m.38900 type:complete len:214 (+) Transcript_9469:1631-2272(+)
MTLRSASEFHTLRSTSRPAAQHVQSSATCLMTFGRCTLTATSWPLCRRPRYTWPSDADAMRVVPSSANSVGAPASASAAMYGWPGASGPSQLRSSAMVRHASSSSKGLFCSCSFFSAFAASSPMRSARCDSVWPILVKTGPSSLSASRRATSRVRSSAGTPSSDTHSLPTAVSLAMMTASRAATSAGRVPFWKKASILGRLNSPRSSSYSSPL